MEDNRDSSERGLPIIRSVGWATAIAGIVIVCLFIWSTRRADDVTIERQKQLVATVLQQSTAQIAHEQEASTVWDDALQHLRQDPPDPAWLDANLGVWFNTYYGHDAVLIVDGDNRPVYGMANGKRMAPDVIRNAISPELYPLLTALRSAMRHRGVISYPKPRTPGANDVAMVQGHPSIISAKPVISESGTISQKPGREFIHISVRHLDGNFTTSLARQYGFDGARFVKVLGAAPREAAVAVQARNGKRIGWIVWKPFRPGTTVLRQIGIMLALSLFAIAIFVNVVIGRLRRRTRELHHSRAEAQHLAYRDSLTGLANRALFDARLDRELLQVRQGGAKLALLFLDLDRFKYVNDSFGHPAGDELIRQVAKRLEGMMREKDMIARLGGDEFAVIQHEIPSDSAAELLCRRIVEKLGLPFNLGGTTINVGVSVGLAVAPEDGADRVELSRKADIALYDAKASGKGRYAIFAAEMDENVRLRQAIESDLRDALIDCKAFELYYQPLYATDSCQLIGAEALIRWHHPTRGLLLPGSFIPVAEETGLIDALGDWSIRQACSAARAWKLSVIAINISTRQLRDPGFPDRVLQLVEASGLPPHMVELEITETCLMENAADCQASLERLRATGVRIALDDFGTGFSSLAQLREIAIDRVKIDQTFIAGLDLANGRTIVRAIVDMAHASGLAATAEGVETDEQRSFLAEIGCGSFQGNLLSMAIREDQLTALLDRR